MLRFLRLPFAYRKLLKQSVFCVTIGCTFVLLLLASLPGSVPVSYLDRLLQAQGTLGLRRFLNAPKPKPVPVCVGHNASRREVEDLFCLPKPKFDPDIKNPCWWANYTNDLSQWMHRRRYRNDLLRPRATGSRVLKCLPYAHIICCSKSGTTDLFVRLSVHPDYVKTGYKGKEHFVLELA
ncbi:hypothetical protein BaRGS_00027973 [Batillaria attramentaria]|uniref:Sulfotransferase n=1 Tax=Batillaria attramentaria TaxID=370345 RepID=A0ABD0K173_9CAEN